MPMDSMQTETSLRSFQQEKIILMVQPLRPPGQSPTNRRIGTSMQPPGFLSRFLGVTIAAVLVGGAIVSAVAFSLIVLPVVLFVGAIAMGYVWWRTRGVRRQLREQMSAMEAELARQNGNMGAGGPARGGPGARRGGVIIEGDEFIHEARPDQPSGPPRS